ncbi:MAG: ATP-binding protein, partial [Solirubrobacterales bacterium]
MPGPSAGRAGTERACPLGACDGSGWIVGPEDVARPCECRAERLRRARSRGIASVIPAKYRGVSFERPPVTEIEPMVVRVVRAYTEELAANLDAGKGLWLMGDTGTGKTTLAMLISKATLAAGRSVAIYSLPKLLARIRRTYDADPGEDSYLALFGQLTSVDLLHIDDLGAEKRSDWVLEQLYALVNERYEAQRSILATTNLEEPALEEQIGDRT